MAEHPLALGDDGVGLQKACKPGVVPSGPVIIQVGDLLVFALTGVAQRSRCAAGGQAGGAPGVVAQLGEQVTVGVNHNLTCPRIANLKSPLFITQNVHSPPFRIL